MNAEQREEWEMTLDQPFDWETNSAAPSQSQLEAEGSSFMAFIGGGMPGMSTGG